MQDQLYTAGPWEAFDSGLIFAPPAQDADTDAAILICDVGEIDETTPDRRADAMLIAAAPELYAAVQQALIALNTVLRFPVPDLLSDSYRIAAVCDRALAKAKDGAK